MSVETPPIFIQSGGETAERGRRALAALSGLRGGVVATTDLAVTENGTPNMSVNVATGQVFIPGTEGTYQGVYIVENRGALNVAISPADATNARKDLIVAKVQDAVYSGATNAASIVVVTGTPAASPAEPTKPSNSWVLAMVDVPANDTAITNSQITDRRSSQTGQQGLAASLGGIIMLPTGSGSFPAHLKGRMVYEEATNRAFISDGTTWQQFANGKQVLTRAQVQSTVSWTTETTIVTASSVTLLASHWYEIKAIIPQVVTSTAGSGELTTFRIKVGATSYMDWNSSEVASTGRGGHSQSVFLNCTADIGAGATVFTLTAQRVVGTLTHQVPAAGSLRLQLAVIDHGLV